MATEVIAIVLEWNVWVGDFNSRKIKQYNIFRHGGFYEDCQRAYKKYGHGKTEDREAFLEQVRRGMMFCYWSKCEWEVIINHWPPHSDEEAIKVDVYDQVTMNWDRFADYIWENRKELKNAPV